MPVTADQINAIINRTQGQLDAGSRAAISQAIGLVLAEVAAMQAAPVVMAVSDPAFPSGQVAVASGAILIAPSTPTASQIEFKV